MKLRTTFRFASSAAYYTPDLKNGTIVTGEAWCLVVEIYKIVRMVKRNDWKEKLLY